MTMPTYEQKTIIRTAEITLGPDDRYFKEVAISEDGTERVVKQGIAFADGTTREASWCKLTKFTPRKSDDGRVLVETEVRKE